ncbi:DUF2332 domain-containing protein [Actinomadura gamaensis]|uniref:DUF2332 domain-containing protein n=1 Tax=Actinomadura gamaensis TaxID=1763541 RepID=A0ABV9TX74_9ACTN
MTTAIRDALLAQALTCEHGGSPMYAELLRRAADEPDGPIAAVLSDGPDAGRCLRLLGAVHRLVLEGRAPDLAAHYPTAATTPTNALATSAPPPTTGAGTTRHATDVSTAGDAANTNAAMSGAIASPTTTNTNTNTTSVSAARAATGANTTTGATTAGAAGGGTADPLDAWPAFRALLAERPDEVRAAMAGAPQTNEVGRAAPLVGGLLSIMAAIGERPVRLLEVGASAGLNLRADHYRYESGGLGFGPADSPVVLRDAWLGSPPPLTGGLSIVERRGCDLAPVDPVADAVRLLSFVWPDQHERVARLRGALEIAARVPATVVQADAATFLADLEPRPDVVTVVWHSLMWQYLSPAEQAQVTASIERAGSLATPDAPVAHLYLEQANDADFHSLPVLTLRLWPHHGGERRILADTPHHGVPATWR